MRTLAEIQNDSINAPFSPKVFHPTSWKNLTIVPRTLFSFSFGLRDRAPETVDTEEPISVEISDGVEDLTFFDRVRPREPVAEPVRLGTPMQLRSETRKLPHCFQLLSKAP